MEVVIGTSVFWLTMGLVFVSFVALPVLRAAALVASAIHTATRHLAGTLRTRSLKLAPDRPLGLTGLTPHLADFVRQTRFLTLEFRRYTEQSVLWPDAAEREPTWWSGLLSISGYESHTTATRETWEWVRMLEQLPRADRELLASCGIEPEPVRELLAAQIGVASQVNALAGLLEGFDQRLGMLDERGYRGTPRTSEHASGTARRDAELRDEEDEPAVRARRRQLAALLDAHRLDIAKAAGTYAGSPAERDDLEQDIALALWQALPNFRGESSLRTFVHRIARYCHYRVLRRRSRVKFECYEDSLDERTPCAESWLENAEQSERLRGALEALPEGPRRALTLYLEGKSYGEIARILGTSEGNVSVRLVRARQRLALELAAA